jgi:hypothetical protein
MNRLPALACPWFLLLVAAVAHAQPAPGERPVYTCLVCARSPLTGPVWKHALGFVCKDCYDLETRCHHCGLPARPGFAKTTDGRIFCERDLPVIVLSTNEAVKIFRETAAAVAALTRPGMTLQQANVSVTLSDVAYWTGTDAAADLHRVGIAHSRRTGAGMAHNVVLLSGQHRDRLVSVCAHEFTHLWINENRAVDRTFDADALEAVCELVAHALAEARRDTNELERIRTSAYTRGAITNLLDLTATHGLPAVLAWVKEGHEPSPDHAQLSVFSGKRGAAWARPAVSLPVPERLMLTGLIGGGTDRAVAVINGQMFTASQRRNVRVRDRSIAVLCQEIGTDFVIVTTDDSPERLTLRLERP